MYSESEVLEMVDKSVEAGLKLFSEKKYFMADVLLSQTLKVNPDNVRALQILGLIKHNADKLDEAIGIFKKALEYDPNNAENHNNIALSYGRQGKFSTAIDHLVTAIDINPKCHYLYSNLGIQHRQNKQPGLAMEFFRHSLHLKPDPQTYCMLGGCYGELRRLHEAEDCFRRALELDPQFAPAHCDLATIHHLRGDWAEGWKEYEWRFEAHEQTKFWFKLYDHGKRWYGEPLDGKRIILHNEQGAGDSIHFFRYVPLLKKMGANVIVHCSEDLASLYAPHVDEVYTTDPSGIPLFLDRPKDYPMPEYDYFTSLLSLPYLLGNPAIPKTPYLFTDHKINLDVYSDYFKVGIVWAGNPQHPNDAIRSCRLNRFRAIHDLPGVKLFSLQKDKRHRQYRYSTESVDLTEKCEDMKIVDMADQMNTFEDTAAILKSLDLVVSVDTSVVHLAGAIGTPCWAMIPYNTDWRWKLTGGTTEWYSSVRLFRQPEPGNWNAAFDCVLEELKKEIS